MNPAIYIGTQAKYRLAIRILFLGDKAKRKDSRKSSVSGQGQEYGGAKFYVRQMSSSNETPTEPQPTSDRQGILSGRQLNRQVSFQ